MEATLTQTIRSVRGPERKNKKGPQKRFCSARLPERSHDHDPAKPSRFEMRLPEVAIAREAEGSFCTMPVPRHPTGEPLPTSLRLECNG